MTPPSKTMTPRWADAFVYGRNKKTIKRDLPDLTDNEVINSILCLVIWDNLLIFKVVKPLAKIMYVPSNDSTRLAIEHLDQVKYEVGFDSIEYNKNGNAWVKVSALEHINYAYYHELYSFGSVWTNEQVRKYLIYERFEYEGKQYMLRTNTYTEVAELFEKA